MGISRLGVLILLVSLSRHTSADDSGTHLTLGNQTDDDLLQMRIEGGIGDIKLAQATQPVAAPMSDDRTSQNVRRPENVGAGNSSPTGLGWLGNVFSTGVQTYLEIAPASPTGITRMSAAFLGAKTDAASLLQELPFMNIEERAVGFSEPEIQGRRNGQAPARGSYWFAARQDLDTLLSKIDSQIVSDVVAIQGPYSARYGPGLAFYDVQLLESPRFENGSHIHGSTNVQFKTNGDQWHGRQSIWGGDDVGGFRIGYTHRLGNDYESGDGTKFPSGFNSRMFDVALGRDLDDDSRIEFSLLRLDQSDVEFPGNFYDLNFLVTDAYEVKYVRANQLRYDQMQVETWYNRTRLSGDNTGPGKVELYPVFQILSIATDVDAMSSGYSVEFLWEDAQLGEVIAGTDLRYLTQRLGQTTILGNITGDFPIPDAHSSNPGVFLENRKDLNHHMNLRSGIRFDFVSMNADESIDGSTQNFENTLAGEFDQEFQLWSAFMVFENRLNPCWTMEAGVGHSMRPPTMSEMYSVAPFFGVFPQNVLTAVFGNPNLSEERMWQVDLGLSAEYERLNLSLHGFHSWIRDYITLDFLTGSVFSIPRYSYVNTELATLSGFDFQSDLKVANWLSVFSTMNYVEGRDHTRSERISAQRSQPIFQNQGIGLSRSNQSNGSEQPLPVMSPFISRAGFVLHEAVDDPSWSVEFSARIVNGHERVAKFLLEEPTPGYTIYDIRAYALLFSNVMATAGIENVTDKQYQTVYDARNPSDVFRPGINFYFGTQVNY